jgi:hypothetical protein
VRDNVLWVEQPATARDRRRDRNDALVQLAEARWSARTATSGEIFDTHRTSRGGSALRRPSEPGLPPAALWADRRRGPLQSRCVPVARQYVEHQETEPRFPNGPANDIGAFETCVAVPCPEPGSAAGALVAIGVAIVLRRRGEAPLPRLRTASSPTPRAKHSRCRCARGKRCVPRRACASATRGRSTPSSWR